MYFDVSGTVFRICKFFSIFDKKWSILIFSYKMVDGVWISVRHMVTTRFWVLGLVYEMYLRIVLSSVAEKRKDVFCFEVRKSESSSKQQGAFRYFSKARMTDGV